MRDTSIVSVDSVLQSAKHNQRCIHKGVGDKWVPARSEGYPSFLYRVRAAWLVFTGKADALVWEDQ